LRGLIFKYFSDTALFILQALEKDMRAVGGKGSESVKVPSAARQEAPSEIEGAASYASASQITDEDDDESDFDL